MKTYKKRAKVGWGTGKGEKESSNRSERTFVKNELAREIPTSSEQERLSIISEILADEYERETFNQIIKDSPDLIRESSSLSKKKKRAPKRKALESKLIYFQKKLESLRPDGYGNGRLKNYYQENITILKKALESFKKDAK